MIKKIFNDIFTGKDNITYDLWRLLTALAFIVFFIITGFVLHPANGDADFLLKWTSAVGILFTTAAAGIGIKASTEPAPTLTTSTATMSSNNSSVTIQEKSASKNESNGQ